jgi:deoxyribodipyrimidine photo-lyase
MKKSPIAVHWFRRDLRLHDNTAFAHATQSEWPVLPIFIFDPNILQRLEDRTDGRVTFIHDTLNAMHRALQAQGSGIRFFYNTPLEAWEQLMEEFEVKEVFFNRDYEPYARERDGQLYEIWKEKGVVLKTYKDHVVFEKAEVVKDDGKPYTVYTPYSRKWKLRLKEVGLPEPLAYRAAGLIPMEKTAIIPLSEMHFERSMLEIPSSEVPQQIIQHYHETRDIPSMAGTTRWSVHLRFGTISIREAVRLGMAWNEKWLNELIWRDFYQMILFHFPHSVDQAFKPQYDAIEWRKDEEDFKKWCEGKTGYPIVDAGMRELNATGFMHNRVRMVVASFLTKHLLLDWRWGERYFAAKLLDFDLASNVGGWQWAAGSGCDAAPYFRIFNPYNQTDKFDPQHHYIRRWVPEINTQDYPAPIVDHATARERCLRVYKEGLGRG